MDVFSEMSKVTTSHFLKKLFFKMSCATGDEFLLGVDPEDGTATGGFRVVTLSGGYKELMNDAFFKHIPNDILTQNVQRFAGYSNWRADFETSESFQEFAGSAFQQSLVLQSITNTQTSSIFIVPYGFIYSKEDI